MICRNGYISILLCLFFLPAETRGEQKIELVVNLQKKMQSIDCFGASDAWRAGFIGKYWPEEKKEQIADWLFSDQFDQDGNPKGIALSLWRFNIGAGSAEQGRRSDINHSWRRTECFLSKDGQYDFSKQAGQQWFLEAAKKRGVGQFLAFPVAPPWFMSRNGLAKSTDMKQINLKADKFDDFAEFLAKVMAHFSAKGIDFNYISPVNEPQWDWNTPRQEGTFARNSDCYKLIKALDEQITGHGLKTKIVFGEAGAIKYLYGKETDAPKTDNQIHEFFSQDGQYYILGMKNVYPCVSGHSYWSTWPVDNMIKEREMLSQAIAELPSPLKYWQSEYCIMEDNEETAGGWGRDLGINMALYMARIIHYDLTVANASSWQWWTALSQYDYKDGLIYLDNGKNNGVRRADNPVAESLKYDGVCHPSKMLWALGNYSRFVRPGMYRVDIAGSAGVEDRELLYSAYSDGKSIIVVAINYSEQQRVVSVGGSAQIFRTYETSEKYDLSFTGETKADNIILPPRSIVTLISNDRRP